AIDINVDLRAVVTKSDKAGAQETALVPRRAHNRLSHFLQLAQADATPVLDHHLKSEGIAQPGNWRRRQHRETCRMQTTEFSVQLASSFFGENRGARFPQSSNTPKTVIMFETFARSSAETPPIVPHPLMPAVPPNMRSMSPATSRARGCEAP